MKKEYLSTNGRLIFILKTALLQIIVTLISVIFFSVFMYFLEIDFGYASLFATVSVGVGLFFSSYFASKKIGKKGYLIGALIGGITFLAVTIASLLFGSGKFTLNTVFHLVIFMLSAVIGGIYGVGKSKGTASSKIKIRGTKF